MANTLKKKVLMLAQAGDINELKKIMAQGSVHWVDCCLPTGDTPLHIAAHYGMDDVVRFLLDEWINNQVIIDVISNSGKTALHEAAQSAKPAVISFLLERGANPRALKQADWTPLMLACTKKGSEALESCKLLYQSGGPEALSDHNKDGWTPFHIAVREGDLIIVQWLINLLPSLHATHSKNGRTPLHTAALHGLAEVVTLLLQLSASPNTKDSCGSTPVHDAVRSGSIQTLNILISKGGDVNQTNALGQSVVHMAAETGNCDMLEYLLRNCSLTTDGGSFTSTPLHCAIKAGKSEAANILLKFNADPRALDSSGYSCLDLAKTSKCTTTLHLIEAVLTYQSEPQCGMENCPI